MLDSEDTDNCSSQIVDRSPGWGRSSWRFEINRGVYNQHKGSNRNPKELSRPNLGSRGALRSIHRALTVRCFLKTA